MCDQYGLKRCLCRPGEVAAKLVVDAATGRINVQLLPAYSDGYYGGEFPNTCRNADLMRPPTSYDFSQVADDADNADIMSMEKQEAIDTMMQWPVNKLRTKYASYGVAIPEEGMRASKDKWQRRYLERLEDVHKVVSPSDSVTNGSIFAYLSDDNESEPVRLARKIGLVQRKYRSADARDVPAIGAQGNEERMGQYILARPFDVLVGIRDEDLLNASESNRNIVSFRDAGYEVMVEDGRVLHTSVPVQHAAVSDVDNVSFDSILTVPASLLREWIEQAESM